MKQDDEDDDDDDHDNNNDDDDDGDDDESWYPLTFPRIKRQHQKTASNDAKQTGQHVYVCSTVLEACRLKSLDHILPRMMVMMMMMILNIDDVLKYCDAGQARRSGSSSLHFDDDK